MRSIIPLAVILIIACASVAYGIDGSNPMTQDRVIVKNSGGEPIGEVSNMITERSGRIAFLILSLAEQANQGKKEIAVPLEAFSYNHGQRTLTLKATKEQIAAAPEFHASDLNDPAFPERVYRAFGQSPPWTEDLNPKHKPQSSDI